MKNNRVTVGDAISNIVSTAKPQTSKQIRYKNTIFEDSNEPKQERLFATSEEELHVLEPKFDTENLPTITYDKKIHYLSDFYEIAESLDSLIQKVNAVEGEEKVGVAFDMEWTFSFQTGPEKTALIQVCMDLNECFLFHLPRLKKLPASLALFLNHPRVTLHGVNIKNDLRKLERDFPVIRANKMIENCIDLGIWYNEVFNSSGRWSLERLVLQTLRMRIDKSRHIRQSKWHIFPLNEKQQKYAAIDVFVSRNSLNSNIRQLEETAEKRKQIDS